METSKYVKVLLAMVEIDSVISLSLKADFRMARM